MSNPDAGGFRVTDTRENSVDVPMALIGAVGGAFGMSIVYGLIGKVIGEFSVLALLVGGTAGAAAFKLGHGRSPLVGGVAAGLSLVAILGAKIMIGVPDGAAVSWFSWHMQPFDIIFCYLLSPAVAFALAGSEKARALLKKLPFRLPI